MLSFVPISTSTSEEISQASEDQRQKWHLEIKKNARPAAPSALSVHYKHIRYMIPHNGTSKLATTGAWTSVLSSCSVFHRYPILQHIRQASRLCVCSAHGALDFLYFLQTHWWEFSLFPAVLLSTQCQGPLLPKPQVEYFQILSAPSLPALTLAVSCLSMPCSTPCSYTLKVLFQIYRDAMNARYPQSAVASSNSLLITKNI